MGFDAGAVQALTRHGRERSPITRQHYASLISRSFLLFLAEIAVLDMRNHLFAAATTLLLLPGTVSAQQSQIPAPVRAAADVIQQSSLKRDVDYLAADALRGRETPSPGLDSAAAYVARRLAAMKLAPAGDDGTYRQHYTIRSVSLDTTNTWLEVGGRRFSFGNDLLVQNFAENLVLAVEPVGRDQRDEKL